MHNCADTTMSPFESMPIIKKGNNSPGLTAKNGSELGTCAASFGLMNSLSVRRLHAQMGNIHWLSPLVPPSEMIAHASSHYCPLPFHLVGWLIGCDDFVPALASGTAKILNAANIVVPGRRMANRRSRRGRYSACCWCCRCLLGADETGGQRGGQGGHPLSERQFNEETQKA